MDRPTCPKCTMPNVQERHGRNGKFLAVVQTYDSGHSYFRRLHTHEECAAYKADFDARVAESLSALERAETNRLHGLRGSRLMDRYVAIYGREAVGANWDRLYARWLAPIV